MRCAWPACAQEVDETQDHVRQARLNAEGLPRRGLYDVWHSACHRLAYPEKGPITSPAQEPEVAAGQGELLL